MKKHLGPAKLGKIKVFLSCLCLLLLFGVNFSFGAKLWFSSEKNVLIENCPTKIDVMLDTQWVMTTAMDLRVIFSPQEMLLNDFDGEWSLFRAYTVPIFPIISDSVFTGQKIMYSLLSTLSRWWIQGKGKVWTLLITPVTWSQSVYLQFYVVPYVDENDSNVIVVSWWKAYDALWNSDSLLLPVVKGDCDPKEIEIKPNILPFSSWEIILINNTEFRSQFYFQELKDTIFWWIAVHRKKIVWFFLILLLLTGGISFYRFRYKVF